MAPLGHGDTDPPSDSRYDFTQEVDPHGCRWLAVRMPPPMQEEVEPGLQIGLWLVYPACCSSGVATPLVPGRDTCEAARFDIAPSTSGRRQSRLIRTDGHFRIQAGGLIGECLGSDG